MILISVGEPNLFASFVKCFEGVEPGDNKIDASFNLLFTSNFKIPSEILMG